ncbi:MAG: nucleotidyl transferase AbiEii/AbiGii toxin family protein [Candidatus Enteromonas sp.]
MELEKTKARIRKIAEDNSIDHQAAWATLFFDEFIFRLFRSKFKDMFVFKGGFYLQSIVGAHSRSTMDMDFKLMRSDLSDEQLESILREICSMDAGSNIILRFDSISDITAETKYGGKAIEINGSFLSPMVL